MRLSAKADYALRASLELASAGEGHVKAEALARAQAIPLRFLEQILLDLKHAGLVASQRGAEGGYWPAKPPIEISLADVIRAVEGPLANVRGHAPEALEYPGAAEKLQEVWLALRANVRAVLERVSLADIARGELPPQVEELTRDADAWVRR
jgi:Rrf2 family protein